MGEADLGVVTTGRGCGQDLDDNARVWIKTIRKTMDTTGIEDPAGRGTSFIKAERLSVDDKFDFSRAVDELAHWFDREFWSS